MVGMYFPQPIRRPETTKLANSSISVLVGSSIFLGWRYQSRSYCLMADDRSNVDVGNIALVLMILPLNNLYKCEDIKSTFIKSYYSIIILNNKESHIAQ